MGSPTSKYGAFEAEADVGAIAPNDAAVTGAVAARHRRLAGELRRRERAARARRASARDRTRARLPARTAALRSRASGRARPRRWGRARPPLRGASSGTRAERAARPAARRGTAAARCRSRRRRAAAAATSRPNPVPRGPVHVDRVADLQRADRTRSRPDRVEEEAELARRRHAEAEGTRKHAPGRLEHEELAGSAGLERAPREPQQRVRPDRFAPHNPTVLTPHVSSALPTWVTALRGRRPALPAGRPETPRTCRQPKEGAGRGTV